MIVKRTASECTKYHGRRGRSSCAHAHNPLSPAVCIHPFTVNTAADWLACRTMENSKVSSCRMLCD